MLTTERPCRQKSLESWLQKTFGQSFIVTLSDATCPESELSPVELLPTEREIFTQLGSAKRQASWLTGRRALKALCQQINEQAGFSFPGNIDTGLIPFPHPRISITHSGALALAVYLAPEPQGDGQGNNAQHPPYTGIGVDYQIFRPIRHRSQRMFLTPDEREWISRLDAQEAPKELIRLWTVKEALYKSHPLNRQTRYTDYQLLTPEKPSGSANLNRSASNLPSDKPRGERFAYASIPFAEGYLSLALKHANNPESFQD